VRPRPRRPLGGSHGRGRRPGRRRRASIRRRWTMAARRRWRQPPLPAVPARRR
jgi:hypothetical protein